MKRTQSKKTLTSLQDIPTPETPDPQDEHNNPMPTPNYQDPDTEQPRDAVDDNDLDEFKRVLGQEQMSGGVIKIYRRGPAESKFSYVAEVAPENFSMEYLKVTFGGGDYQLKFIRKDGKFANKINASIDNRFKGSIDTTPKDSVQAITFPQPAPQDNSLLLAIMQQGQQQSNQMLQMMLAMMDNNAKTLTAALSSLSNGQAKASSQAPVSEPASIILSAVMPLLLKQMDSHQGPDLNAQLDLLGKLKDLTEPGSPSAKEDKPDMLDKIMTIGGPILSGLFSAMQQRGGGMAGFPTGAPIDIAGQGYPQVSAPQASGSPTPMHQPQPSPSPQPQAPAAPARNPQPAPAPAPAAPAGGMQNGPEPVLVPAGDDDLPLTQEERIALIMQLRTFAPLLVSAASNDSSVESYYDIVNDAMTPRYINALVEVLKEPDWINTLFGEHAGAVNQYAGWFHNLKEEFLRGDVGVEERIANE